MEKIQYKPFVLIAVGTIDSEDILRVYGNKKAVVLVNNLLYYRDYASIKLEFRQSVEDVLEYLFQLGKSSIGYLGTLKMSTNHQFVAKL